MKPTSNNIHPTAIIHEKTNIHPSVTIGAFSVIEEGVSIQKNTHLANHVTLKKNTTLGENNFIHSQAIIGDDPQDLSFNSSTISGVTIGDNNVIRESTTIHRATKENQSTTIGNNNFLMVNSHIAHDCKIHNQVIIANNSLIAGHVEIFDKAFISGNCAIHQHVHIGTLAMVGGLTRANADIPPYSLTYGFDALYSGLNLVGLRRAGFPSAVMQKVKSFYQLYYQHTPRKSLEILKEIKNKKEFIQEEEVIYNFIIESKRGLLKSKDFFKDKKE